MRTARHLRRTLVWYTFGTACFIALLVGIILMAQDHTLTSTTIASSIGSNLIASVAFAVMFTLATWAQNREVEDTISEGFAQLTDRTTRNLADTNRLFLPQKRYDALNPTAGTFGDDYNRDVTKDLETSDFFAFSGPSARYVAARLLAARHYPQQIRVTMLGPAHVAAIKRHASDRTVWPRLKGQAVDDIVRKLGEELLMNLVSLFDCRHLCPIEVLFGEHTAVHRYVMMDEAVYVSWYHSPKSARMEMPESYRFGKESYVYSTFRLDLMRQFEISPDKVVFGAHDTDNDLIEHLRRLTSRGEIDENDLKRWRAEQVRDTADFTRYLNRLYGDLNHHLPEEARTAHPTDKVP